jgi:hypothetical protein
VTESIEASRKEWVESLAQDDAERVIFQLEVRLKAIDRFFNSENHPARSTGSISLRDNLKVELTIIDRQLRRLQRLGQKILDDPEMNALVFQCYLESQWLKDEQRDVMLARHRDQVTPQESLYTLLVGLRSLAQLTAGLRRADSVHLPTFRALADQYRSLIVHNRFFNPLSHRTFFPTSEWTENPVLRQCIRNAPSRNLRRALGFAMLVLGRYLTILSWVNSSAPWEEITDALPLFALLRSEFRTLLPFLERHIARRFFPMGCRIPAEENFLACVDSMAFQLAAESNKAFESFLLDYVECKRLRDLQSRVEAVRQLMTVFFELATTEFLKIVSPDIATEAIFPEVISRYEQSARLREDLWVFVEILTFVIERISSSEINAAEKRRSYRCLLDFLTYFENLSFQAVRYTEYDSFLEFFHEMRPLREESFEDEARNQDIVSNFQCFQIFITMVLGHVEQRTELQNVPLDHAQARLTFEQFVAGT